MDHFDDVFEQVSECLNVHLLQRVARLRLLKVHIAEIKSDRLGRKEPNEVLQHVDWNSLACVRAVNVPLLRGEHVWVENVEAA